MSIDFAKIAEMSQTVELLETSESMTAYGIGKVINQVLAHMGSHIRSEPQTIYNYAANGKINGVKKVKGDGVRYTDDEVEQFVAKFIAARLRTRAVDEELNEDNEDD